MKRNILYSATIVALTLLLNLQVNAQVAINSTGAAPNGSAMLDISSTTGGVLIPRMTQAQRNAIAGVEGLIIYQTDGTPGFYSYKGTGWSLISQWNTAGTTAYYNTGSVAIGATSANVSAVLDLTSTAKGILIPRMTSAQRTAIASPATGLLVFQTDAPTGFYYYSGGWSQLGGGSGTSQWTTNGNDIYYTTGGVAVGISSPKATAALDVTSTTKGVLIPRMTQTQRNAITSPENGLLIFQTDNTPGFYYYSSALSSWNNIGVAAGVSSVEVTSPITNTGSSAIPKIGIKKATATVDGYLAYTDWVKFNNKWTLNEDLLYQVSGSVGIGTNAPALKLHVLNTNPTGYVARLQNASTETTAGVLQLLVGPDGGNTDNKFISFRDGGNNELGHIYYDPNSGLAFSTYSDRRLKTNIKDTRYSLNTLMSIKVVDYNWKRNPNLATQTGFIAQDLYEVFPNAVVKPTDEASNWMLRMEALTPLLVKSIQDQQAIIKAQDDKIKSLEERLSALEQKIGK